MVETSDFNSRYADIITHSNNWKIYDWLAWVDVWCMFICTGIHFQGIIPSVKQAPKAPPRYQHPADFTDVVHRMHLAVNFMVRP